MRRDRSRAPVVAIAVLATAMAACASLEGLDDYKACLSDCDGDGLPHDAGLAHDASVEASGADVSVGDAPADDDVDDAGGPGDGGAGSDASSADAGGSDAMPPSDAGDAATRPLCTPPTDLDGGGLVVYYPFEGDTTDHSGKGNNGIATAVDVSYGAGKVGQAVTIKAAGQGIAVTGGTVLTGGKTLCAWVNPATGTSGAGLPVFTGGNNFYDLETASGPTAGSCSVTASTLFMDNGTCSTTTLAATPGAWSFVCFAYGVGSTTFFANGATQVVTGNQYDPYILDQIFVGSNRLGGSTTAKLFSGQIDEVSVWSAALSKVDMTVLYDGANGCRLR